MTPMPWFRFYSEAVRDTKLRRIARKTDRPFAETVGTWAIILSFASESPKRGTLLLSDGNPVDPDDISDVAGCNADETLQQLQSNGMITVTDGIICVSAWNKRQYESDNSTPRVNKFRDKQRNVSETLHERYSNADVTPSESDTESDSDTESETYPETEVEEDRRPAAQSTTTAKTPDPKFQERTEMTRQYQTVLGAPSTAVYPDMIHYMTQLQARDAVAWWSLAIKETVGAKRPGWQYMKAVLTAWLAAGQPSTNGKAPKPKQTKPTRFVVAVGDENVYYRTENGVDVEERREARPM